LVVDARGLDRDGTVRLLSAILANSVWLPDAACLGHHDLDDELPGRG
jgi:hypothetical protein